MLTVEIILLLLRLYSCCWNNILVDENRWRNVYKRGLKPRVKVIFLLNPTLIQIDSLTTLTDMIVEVWSTSKVPFVPKDQHLGASHGDKSKRSSPQRPTKVSRREHLAPTMGSDKTWSHPHLRLSLLPWWETQGKNRWDLKVARPPPSNKLWRSWGFSRRQTKNIDASKANLGGSQGQAIMTTSRSPSRPRTPSRGNAVESSLPYGRDWGLSNNYGGARTSQWGVVQDQRGVAEDLAPTRPTSHPETFLDLSSRDDPKSFSQQIMEESVPPHYITPNIVFFSTLEDPESHLKVFRAQ